jgi:hypothetical protein
VWSAALELPTAEGLDKQELVNGALVVVQTETRIMLEQLRALQTIDSAAFEKIVAEIRNLLSAVYLGHQWSAVKAQISDSILMALPLFAGLLPDQENEISKEELNDLEKYLLDLEQMLRDTDIPTELSTIFRLQISAIRQALIFYAVTGKKAIEAATTSSIGELLMRKNDFQQVETTPFWKRYAEFWPKICAVVDGADKVEKVAKITERVIFLLGKIS